MQKIPAKYFGIWDFVLIRECIEMPDKNNTRKIESFWIIGALTKKVSKSLSNKKGIPAETDSLRPKKTSAVLFQS